MLGYFVSPQEEMSVQQQGVFGVCFQLFIRVLHANEHLRQIHAYKWAVLTNSTMLRCSLQ